MQEFLQTVNWKTTGYAIGYLICKVIGGLYPPISGVCEVIEPLIVAGGFISTATPRACRASCAPSMCWHLRRRSIRPCWCHCRRQR